MTNTIKSVARTNFDSGASQSEAQRQGLENAFGSVLTLVTMQCMERNMANLHEAVTEAEEDT